MSAPIICSGCGWEIDPETCSCGVGKEFHDPMECGHNFVPVGCTCGFVDAEKHKAPSHQKLTLKGGTKITPEEAVKALDAAMTIIEAVGTTGIHSRGRYAEVWMKKYYPNWA